MDKRRASRIWNHIVVPAYMESCALGRGNSSADPHDVIVSIINNGASKEEIKGVVAVIAGLQKKNLAFSEENRSWLYDNALVDFSKGFKYWKAALGNINKIPAEFLNDLTSELYLNWNKWPSW